MIFLFLLSLFAAFVSSSANNFEIDVNSIKKTDHTYSMILENKKFKRSNLLANYFNSLKILFSLTNTCPATNDLKPESIQTNNETRKAFLLFESLDERVLRVKINDHEAERWEVPIYNPDARKYYKPAPIKTMGMACTSCPFGFSLTDKHTGREFVSALSENLNFIFTDKLIEFGLWFPADAIYGVGERVTPSFELCDGNYRECIYTSFNKDVHTPLDKGEFPGGNQTYGHQPFYMLKLKSNQFLGVLFLNSNAQDTIIARKEDGISVTHKTIGGILDFFFFYPGQAEEVIKNYHSFIGRPYLPPIWSLGFHQCRWGWRSLDEVKSVVSSFEHADIPLDVVWADIDYMQNSRDFTVSRDRYKDLDKFVDDLHREGMYWVPIVDAGLAYDVNDKYYKKGEEMNAFVRSARTKKTLVGHVWPGPAVYPAWMNVNASSIWHLGLSDLYAQVKFDGLWIDMNEASNFCDGESGTDNSEEVYGADHHDPTEFDNLPYYPGKADLKTRAISPSGYHVVNDQYGDKFYKEYNLHSLWAFHQANSTNRFFTEVQKKRPFILTRANSPGIGRFASKWLGDNHSTWDDMRYSIIGMYNYQLFGIPLIGSDICGFIDNTNEELCLRWIQLGAFYPFSRNHNTIGASNQEPYVWDSVAKAGRNAIRQKYSILRYYYTKLFEVSLNGGTLVKPLFFDHPEDSKIYEYRNKAFMIGSALMVAPALEPNVTEVSTYLPNQNWFDLFSGNQILRYVPDAKEGKEVKLKADFEYVNVLVKGGSIVPFQEALSGRIRKVTTLNSLDLDVIIAPDGKGKAKGNIIFDNQEAIDPIATNEYTIIDLDFSMENKVLKVTTKSSYKLNEPVEKFKKLTIFGAESMSKINFASIKDKQGTIITVPGQHNTEKKTLEFNQRINANWGDIDTITFSETNS